MRVGVWAYLCVITVVFSTSLRARHLTDPHMACAMEVSRSALDPRFSADDPISFIRSQGHTASMGNVVSTYDERLKTRIYFPLSEPDRDGNIPLVAPDSDGVVVYFHGSGTMKAGGRNFISKMATIRNSGLSPVSLDLPFHSEGPVDSQFENLDYFMDWLHHFVSRLKASGKPIYFMGHSFGPFVIKEYLSRYPDDVKGALLVAYASDYHPAMKWTYEKITLPGMRFIDEDVLDSVNNDLGGEWAGMMEEQASWIKGPVAGTKMVFLRGTMDEWFPENHVLPRKVGVKQPYGPRVAEQWLKRKFPQAEFIFVEDIGHYIFEAKAKSGRNAILEALFQLAEVPEQRRFSETAPARSARAEVAHLYYVNPLFRDWLGNRYRARMATEQGAENALRGWFAAKVKMWREILERMPQVAPKFYAARQISVEKAYFQLERLEHGLYDKGWDMGTQTLQSEYQHYLEKHQLQMAEELGEDPARPIPPPIDGIFSEPEAAKWGASHVYDLTTLRELVRRSGGKIQSEVSRNGVSFSQVTYTLSPEGKVFTGYFVTGEAQSVMRELFEKAYIEQARAVRWQAVAEKWEANVGGMRIKVHLANGKVTLFEILGFSDDSQRNEAA